MEKEFLQLKSFLDSKGIDYEVKEHEPVFTAEEAAKARGIDLKSDVKSMVFAATGTSSEPEFVIALVPSDMKVDTKKLSQYLKKQVRLATPKEVKQAAGCEVGSVHPFGSLFGLRVIADDDILDNDKVSFSAGLHTKSITMKARDMFALINPEIVDIAKT